MKNFTNKDIAEFLELLDTAGELRPIFEKAINVLVGFGPEVSSLFRACSRGVANLHTEFFNQLLENGFTRDEAMMLTVDNKETFHSLLSNSKSLARKK